MNVLLVTPDAVGSTLLQRLITIYMQFHAFDRPVINLHELTNGLVSYYSSDFNRMVLGKPSTEEQWGYHQSLPEIIKMLQQVDHYKTSRLANYHLTRRDDPARDKIPFYRYLDDNFFVISCRRRNIFEHALSWGINKITKKLNVYSTQEKLESFRALYGQPFDLDVNSIVAVCTQYKKYIEWADQNFSIGSYFYYEDHLPEIEKYILDLPIFSAQAQRIGWKEKFGLTFENHNRYTYLSGDLGSLLLTNDQSRLLSSTDRADETKQTDATKLLALLPKSHLRFLISHKRAFHDANECLGRMVELGILVTPLPVKKQTLAEKMKMIRNLDSCVEAYNGWAEANPELANPVDIHSLLQQAHKEREQWMPTLTQDPVPIDPLKIGSS